MMEDNSDYVISVNPHFGTGFSLVIKGILHPEPARS
jgi:hypothetical protein